MTSYLFITSLLHGSVPFLSIVLNQFRSFSHKGFLRQLKSDKDYETFDKSTGLKNLQWNQGNLIKISNN